MTAVADLNDGDRIWFWQDEAGVRCSPRHRTLKAALSFRKNWNPSTGKSTRWEWDADQKRSKHVMIDGEKFPSSEQPAKLMVAVYEVRELNEEEQSKVNQVLQLIEEGMV